MDAKIQATIDNLKKRRFNVIFAESKEAAKKMIIELIPKNSTIGFGGSITLEEIGILDYYRNSIDYDLLDRTATISPDEKSRIAHECLDADFFLSGANGITEDGKIVNIDYRGNRVAAILFGPDKVIIVAGKNKISKDVDESIKRIKNIVVKKNAKRLDWKTPCFFSDECLDCSSDKRMCGVITISEFQTVPDRITVFIVDEELGY